ncbi:hypothetical protein M231_01494 [Tremella mesenterica]|uniref:PH domain-containing protein n=1 Tax=Tremella mesenterica TaxID=5217 RepID=A0A4Q1BSS0_TREME|nr:hypothetical protein M231_01494 [Tremella mesenterica]
MTHIARKLVKALGPSKEKEEEDHVPAGSVTAIYHTRPQIPNLVKTSLPGKIVRSKIASSCEVFGLLKALAAGGNGVAGPEEAVDSDEDEESSFKVQGQNGYVVDPSKTPTPNNVNDLPHVESSTTLRPGYKTGSVPHRPEDLPGETEAEKRAALNKWMEETLEESKNNAASARFAALSVGNYSPWVNRKNDHKIAHQTKVHKRPRPELPCPPPPASDSETPLDESEHPELDISPGALGPRIDTDSDSSRPPSIAPSESSVASSYTSATSLGLVDDDGIPFFGPDIPDDLKLKAIIEDFGNIADLMENSDGTPGEPERMLAESKGSLFKGVMMIGNLHLTTHRILFHAVLPPDSAYQSRPNPDAINANNVDAATAALAHQPDVLYSGPVTVHRIGLLTPRRVWMELSSEMITTFPSATESGRVRPIRSILLSSIRRLQPFDHEHPCEFYASYEAADGLRTTHFTVDTEQSAVQWRREIEGALYRHARSRLKEITEGRQANASILGEPQTSDGWSMMRVCVPLDRVTIKGIHDYHSFSTLVGLDIDIGSHRARPVRKQPSEDHLVREDSTPPGQTRRKFSIRTSLSRVGSPKPSRESSPASRHRSPVPGSPETPPVPAWQPPRWLDTTLPPKLALAGSGGRSMLPPGYETNADPRHEYHFNVALLNEQAWFAEALSAAVKASHGRRYKAGVRPPDMILTVGGHDCLAGDDELEALGLEFPRQSSSSLEDDIDEDGQGIGSQTRKAEKAEQAAKLFGLKPEEGIWLKRCYVCSGLIPARGHIILTREYICFWRKNTVGSDVKYRFRCKDVKGAVAVPSTRAAFHGMALQIHSHHDLKFEFWSQATRDQVIQRISELCNPLSPIETLGSPLPISQMTSLSMSDISQPSILSEPNLTTSPTETPSINSGMTSAVRSTSPIPMHAADILAPPKETMFMSKAFPDEALAYMPFIANRPWDAKTTRLTPRTFTCLTIGSRGDVQPYIALCLRLKQDGHRTVIVTHFSPDGGPRARPGIISITDAAKL